MSHPLGGGDVSAGLDGRADFAKYDLYNTFQRTVLSPEKGYDAEYLGGGAFVRWRTLVGSHVALDLGTRADAVHYQSLDRVAGSPQQDDGDVVVSPKLGLRYLVAGGWSLLGSLSAGFRGAPGVIGDPSLEPVRGWSKELGARYDGGSSPPSSRCSGWTSLRTNSGSGHSRRPAHRREPEAGGEPRCRGEGDSAGQPYARRDLERRSRQRRSGLLSHTADRSAAAGGRRMAHPFVPHFTSSRWSRAIRCRTWRSGWGEWECRRHGALASPPGLCFDFPDPIPPSVSPTRRRNPYAVVDAGASLHVPALGAVLDLELQNIFSTKYPEIRSSGFINPGAPRTLRAAFRFADHE